MLFLFFLDKGVALRMITQAVPDCREPSPVAENRPRQQRTVPGCIIQYTVFDIEFRSPTSVCKDSYNSFSRHCLTLVPLQHPE